MLSLIFPKSALTRLHASHDGNGKVEGTESGCVGLSSFFIVSLHARRSSRNTSKYTRRG